MVERTTENASEHPALRRLALLATGCTGADIERLVREVRRKVGRQQRSMTWSDLKDALLAGQPSLSDDLRWRTAIHEAGHAIVFLETGVADIVTASVGIGGIGNVATRLNSHLPQTESWLMSYIACMLAGRTAELLAFGEGLAGAGGTDDSDLARANHYAVNAETRLGFSSHQPLLYRQIGGGINELSLDRGLAERVNDRLLKAEAIARSLLVSRTDALHAIATRLNEAGIMSGDEVSELLASYTDAAAETER
jgi:ATP-dependent Zn protease